MGRRPLGVRTESQLTDRHAAGSEVDHEPAEFRRDCEGIVEALQNSVMIGDGPAKREEIIVSLGLRDKISFQHTGIHYLLHTLVNPIVSILLGQRQELNRRARYVLVGFWVILPEGGIVGHVRVEYVEGRSPMGATFG